MGRRSRPAPPPPPPPAKTEAVKKQEKKEKELDEKIEVREQAAKDATKRKKRGRMSLISGDERGIKTTLG